MTTEDSTDKVPDIIEYAVIRRTATVEVWVPVHTYRAGKDDKSRVMSEQEIRDYELSMTGEEAFQMLVECASVVDESKIDQSCTVTFTVGPPDKSDT